MDYIILNSVCQPSNQKRDHQFDGALLSYILMRINFTHDISKYFKSTSSHASAHTAQASRTYNTPHWCTYPAQRTPAHYQAWYPQYSGNQSGQNIIIHNVIRIIMEKYIRFFFIHVQAGCADLPLFNSFQQRLGINERSSRCVNQGKIYLPIIPYSSSVQSTQSLNRTPSSALQKSTQTS